MEIRQALQTGTVLLDLKAPDIRSAIEQTLDQMIDQGKLSAALRERVQKTLLSREIEGTTAIGSSVAVPHAHLDSLVKPAVAFVRLARPIDDLSTPDGEPTRYLFILLGPTNMAGQHLQTLMKIARLVTDHQFRHDLDRAHNREELVEAYDRHKARTTQRVVVPEGSKPHVLTRSGHLCGGMLNDLRMRLPFYIQDFKDGLHPKCLASVLFMFFACLAPAVAFGGLMSVFTNGQIGVIEMLVATAACGVLYALFSGQPLTILAGTGPLLIFTGILHNLCVRLNLPFLPTYAWVGLWTGLLLVVTALAEGCCLIRYITRFTDEIFAALISLIFIYEAINDLVKIFTSHRVKYDSALLALLLALGTYYIAMILAGARRGPYLRYQIREFLTDFGPTIAILSMTLVDLALHEVALPKLAVPESFQPTAQRPWMIDLFSVPAWVMFAAAGPAILATLLIFLNQNITTRLIDKPENHLKKGTAYHWNLLVIGFLIAACSPLGLPWLMASIIPSLNNLRSLAKVEDVVTPRGETQVKIVRVQENRLSPMVIHILIGCSLLFLPLLKTIPMAVLFGLFLYMGISSLASNQFVDRLKLWVMDPALYPPTHYIRKVPIATVHQYTFLQLACLVLLWIVKASPVAILFPLLIGLLVPFRMFVMKQLFTPKHLNVLDAQGNGEGAAKSRVIEESEEHDPIEEDEEDEEGPIETPKVIVR